MMKKAALAALLLGSAWIQHAQDIRHDAVAVNIEVPVRVKGGGYRILHQA